MASIDTITVTICASLCRHCEEYMRKKGPPPRKWDGNKKLPWPIAIYYNGIRYDTITAYDLDAGTFSHINAKQQEFANLVGPDAFLVQRLH